MERVAEGVWLLRGDFRGAMNVYFVEDGDGVVQYDAATKGMRRAVRRAGERLGGIKRVVLGHAHADHRGAALASGAPVYCHADEVAEAEREEAISSYFDLRQLPVAWVRAVYPFLLRRWDGGPVPIAGTLAEGDRVGDFEVLHFPGHSPGLIALWRERDRLALVSDLVYLVDSGRLKALPHGEASVPHPAWAWDHERSKRAVRRFAELEPRVVCAGHDEPLRGANLRATLEKAADRF